MTPREGRGPTRVRLRLDGRRPRRWHAALLDRLAARPGCRVEVDDRAGVDPWPAGADILFELERLIHRLDPFGPAATPPRADIAAWPRPSADVPDLVIDLCGDLPDEGDAPVWRLAFDGVPGETGLLAAALAARPPIATVSAGGRILAAGRVGTEVAGVARTAFADGLSRATTLILKALDGADATALPDAESGPRLVFGALDTSRRIAKLTAGAIVRRLYHLCYYAPHWRVGWRAQDGDGVLGSRSLGGTAWRNLPDDGLRFYADPFPLGPVGSPVLFVEEWIHRQGKALISAVRFGPNGPLGTPVPVLEEAHHLSYPFVFEREGSYWMIPESCGAGAIDLYRATAFPGGWVKEARLLDGIAASDATLWEQDGRWWMFATVRGAEAGAPLGHGSYSDTLHLWSAEDFRGPWRPHPKNPVLVDTAAARPAGRMARRGGALLRPVQDCSGGYGAALAIARVDRLDENGFAQTVETVLKPSPDWPGSRIHTLNAAAGLEFVDGSARVRRFRAAWRRRGRQPVVALEGGTPAPEPGL